jgi:hypothetical protein
VAGNLLTPTLEGYVPRDATAARPWRLGSQVYVAFFGGILAVTAIAYLNALRLRAPAGVRAGIVAIGALGLAVLLVVAAVVFGGGSAPDGARPALTLVGVAAYGGLYLVQRPWDRVYGAFSARDADED